MTDDELRRVADVYNAAAKAGHRPLGAVVHLLGKSKATASRHVEMARKAGLIDSDLGLSGHVNPKAMRVAQALGIEYDALVTAIIEHAGGDLRLGTRTRDCVFHERELDAASPVALNRHADDRSICEIPDYADVRKRHSTA